MTTDTARGEVDGLRLWTAVLAKRGDVAQQHMVRRLVDRVAPLLDRVIETFPTYTLHNATHARNVAELMADLLGPDIAKLTALEAAMLILAAYLHDIGMVFDADVLSSLHQEPEWESFLQNHPAAFVALKNNADVVTPDVAEQYCRVRHAERVFVHLDRIASEDLRWGSVSLRDALGDLCRSHMMGPEELRATNSLSTNFLAQADLRFCAILLRLADILDFDGSRSPEAVYRHLGLARRDTPRRTASDVEWRKHLCSEGVRFPAGNMRRAPRGSNSTSSLDRTIRLWSTTLGSIWTRSRRSLNRVMRC